MGRILLRVLLAALGVLLTIGCRVSERFRQQITRDLVIEVSSTDGAAHHYVFRRANRSVSSRLGRAPSSDLALNFDSGLLGFRTLIRPDAIGEIHRLLLGRRATYTGNATYVLWFWGLTRMVLPYGLEKRVPGDGFPGALTAPNPSSKVHDRVTREPVATELDPTWTAAHAARDRMPMVRGSRGDEIAMW
jgi:hypothetical protein